MTTVALLRGRKMRLAHASIRDGFSSSLHRIGDVADVLKADQVVRTTFLLTELFLTKSSHGLQQEVSRAITHVSLSRLTAAITFLTTWSWYAQIRSSRAGNTRPA